MEVDSPTASRPRMYVDGEAPFGSPSDDSPLISRTGMPPPLASSTRGPRSRPGLVDSRPGFVHSSSLPSMTSSFKIPGSGSIANMGRSLPGVTANTLGAVGGGLRRMPNSLGHTMGESFRVLPGVAANTLGAVGGSLRKMPNSLGHMGESFKIVPNSLGHMGESFVSGANHAIGESFRVTNSLTGSIVGGSGGPGLIESIRAETDRRNFFEKEQSMMMAMQESNSRLNNESYSENHATGMDESYAAFEARASKMMSNSGFDLDESSARRTLDRAKAFQKAIKKSRYGKKAQGLVTNNVTKNLRRLKQLKVYYRNHRHELRAPIFFCLWLAWLFAGAMFYALAPGSNLGYARGFYMALNIGYSIGFGYPSEDANDYLYFSSMYVLTGASFVGAALGFFADKVAKDNEEWFSQLERRKIIEDQIRAQHTTYEGKIRAWLFHYASALKAVALWLIFVLSMIVYSTAYLKWDFREAQYFAISSLSTGGHWSIPHDSPDWLFVLTAVFIMFGVPLMAVAMAQTAYVVISNADIDEAKATIGAAVTKEEIEFLDELGMEEFDGTVDRAEFIILCMVRMGTDHGLISYINQRFMELGFYTGEPLRVEEITQSTHKYVDGQIRRRQSIKGTNIQTFTEYEGNLRSLRQQDQEQHPDLEDGLEFPDTFKPSVPAFQTTPIPLTHDIEESFGETFEETFEEQRTRDFSRSSLGLEMVQHRRLLGSICEIMPEYPADGNLCLSDSESEIVTEPDGFMDHGKGSTSSTEEDLEGDTRSEEDDPQSKRPERKQQEHKVSTGIESSFLRRLIDKLQSGLDDASKHLSTTISTDGTGSHQEPFAVDQEHDAEVSNPQVERMCNSLHQVMNKLQEECVQPFKRDPVAGDKHMPFEDTQSISHRANADGPYCEERQVLRLADIPNPALSLPSDQGRPHDNSVGDGTMFLWIKPKSTTQR